MDKSVFMILQIFILYSFFVFHCSGYKNYCQEWKLECVKNTSITSKVSEDLKIQDSKKCKLKNRFYEGWNQSSARYVILVITNSKQFIPTFRSIFQENRHQRASNILIIKMRGLCDDLIKRVILTLLLGENSGEDRYILLAVLLYQQKHSNLVHYLNLLLLDEIPIISSSTEELRYEDISRIS